MDIYDAQRQTMKYFRHMNQISQCELSRRTCISLQSIWGYEHKTSIPLDRVQTICECFGITIGDWFYTVEMFMKMSKERKAAKQ